MHVAVKLHINLHKIQAFWLDSITTKLAGTQYVKAFSDRFLWQVNDSPILATILDRLSLFV